MSSVFSELFCEWERGLCGIGELAGGTLSKWFIQFCVLFIQFGWIIFRFCLLFRGVSIIRDRWRKINDFLGLG